MKFYSYDYVLSQISQQNWVTVALSVLLLLVTGFFAFKAYRNKRDSKFRELAIISVLALVAMVLIGISNFQTDQDSNNQFQTSLHFIEVISEDLGVDKSEVYISQRRRARSAPGTPRTRQGRVRRDPQRRYDPVAIP